MGSYTVDVATTDTAGTNVTADQAWAKSSKKTRIKSMSLTGSTAPCDRDWETSTV